MTEYITQGFEGTVILKEWIRWHDGRQYIGFSGKVSILQDEELVGFRTKGGESNWVARIEGPSGDAMVILGCQIRGCHVGPAPAGDRSQADYLSIP